MTTFKFKLMGVPSDQAEKSISFDRNDYVLDIKREIYWNYQIHPLKKLISFFFSTIQK